MFTNENIDWIEEIVARYRLENYGNLIRPAFGRGSIADIPNLLKRNLGLETGISVPNVMRGASREVDHMIFFLLDGFGHSTIEYALNNFRVPNIRRFLENCDYTPVTSVFPSTTSTSVVTYQTDLHPVEHGIIGYNAFISEIGTVCNMISLSPVGRNDYQLLENGWSVPVIENNGTIYEEFGRSHINPYLYLPNGIRGSGLTKITGKGASIYGYVTVSQMLTSLRKDLEKAASKSFHFCYVPNIDTISHKIGPFTEETAMEMDAIFHLINEQLLENLRTEGEIGIAISADHGHTVVPRDKINDVRRDRLLSSMLMAPVAGDFRAPILRIKPGMYDTAIQHLEDRYGNDYMIRPSNEMVMEGFFGASKKDSASPDRFGDIIMVPRTEVGLMDSSLGILDPKLNQFDLVGMHGGLSYDEMIVPLIFKSLSANK